MKPRSSGCWCLVIVTATKCLSAYDETSDMYSSHLLRNFLHCAYYNNPSATLLRSLQILLSLLSTTTRQSFTPCSTHARLCTPYHHPHYYPQSFIAHRFPLLLNRHQFRLFLPHFSSLFCRSTDTPPSVIGLYTVIVSHPLHPFRTVHSHMLHRQHSALIGKPKQRNRWYSKGTARNADELDSKF